MCMNVYECYWYVIYTWNREIWFSLSQCQKWEICIRKPHIIFLTIFLNICAYETISFPLTVKCTYIQISVWNRLMYIYIYIYMYIYIYISHRQVKTFRNSIRYIYHNDMFQQETIIFKLFRLFSPYHCRRRLSEIEILSVKTLQLTRGSACHAIIRMTARPDGPEPETRLNTKTGFSGMWIFIIKYDGRESG